MAVEDHPIEYGSFEGTTAEGEYGGGRGARHGHTRSRARHLVTAELAPQGIAALLEASGAAYVNELDALGEAASFHPAPGEWCAKEVVGHVIEAEKRGLAGRIRRFIEQDRPHEIGWDQEAVARERRDCDQGARALRDEFASVRADSVALVRTIGAAQLARGGTHSKVGALTVRDLLHEWVHHDRNHLRQLLANTQSRVWDHMGNAQGFAGE